MSTDLQPAEIVIVRRRAALEADVVKGGVWKIAFADFMTAMMAFFLVMWLINVTDESVRKGVAQYFNPVKLASTTQTRKGLNDPDVPGPEVTNPAKIDSMMETTPDPDGTPGAANGSDATGAKPLRDGLVPGGKAGDFSPTFSDQQLFSDPYAVLDQLAGSLGDQVATGSAPETLGIGSEQQEGAQGGEAFRDPFDPMYWQFLPGRKTATKEGGKAEDVTGQTAIGTLAFEAPASDTEGKAPAMPVEAAAGQDLQAAPDAPLATVSLPQPKAQPKSQALAQAEAGEPAPAAAQEPQPAVTGAGAETVAAMAVQTEALRTEAPRTVQAQTSQPHTGVSRAGAQETAGPQVIAEQTVVSPAAPDSGTQTAETAASEIREAISAAGQGPLAQTASRIEVSQQDGGVLISLTDAENFGMFAVGSAEPRPELVQLMEKVGAVLSSRQGRIVIRGHTDARPFRRAGNDNWRLSTSRAHMALYMLVRGGVDAARIERVEGYADRELKQADDPYAAVNRRIEIFLMEEGA
jgi:chemotaxis protein MotB